MGDQRLSRSAAVPDLSDIGRRLDSTLTFSGSAQSAHDQDCAAAQQVGYGREYMTSGTVSGGIDCAGARVAAGQVKLDHEKVAAENFERGTEDPDNTELTPTPACFLLERLPGELRTSIYELVFREPSGTIVVDLRKPTNDTSSTQTSACSLILTCKQVYEECGSLRFTVNKVHFFVPIFSAASTASQGHRGRRDLIASSLQQIADSQVSTKQLRRVRLFLGRLPRLQNLRWTEFFSSWMSIKNALVCLSTICSSLEVSFEIHLASDVLAQHKFTIDTTRRISDPVELYLVDGSAAELTDVERERMRRIKATISKTTFNVGSVSTESST